MPTVRQNTLRVARLPNRSGQTQVQVSYTSLLHYRTTERKTHTDDDDGKHSHRDHVSLEQKNKWVAPLNDGHAQ